MNSNTELSGVYDYPEHFIYPYNNAHHIYRLHPGEYYR